MAKFRSWNEYYKEFIYWEDGEYDGLDDSDFSWDNAEQGIIIHAIEDVNCFVGDRLELEISYFSDSKDIGSQEENLIKGTLVYKNNAFYIENEKYSQYLTSLKIIDAKVIGNIHEGENE